MEPLPDPEIEELKELVKKDIEIGNETREMVVSMRRSARWGLVFQIIYWVVILGALGTGYYYAAPYLQQLFGFYHEVQSRDAQSHNFVQSLTQTVGQYVTQPSTPKQ